MDNVEKKFKKMKKSLKKDQVLNKFRTPKAEKNLESGSFILQQQFKYLQCPWGTQSLKIVH